MLTRIRLVRKLADSLDGVDVSGFNEGDVLRLPEEDAALLIAEGWARQLRMPAARRRSGPASSIRQYVATDRVPLPSVEQLRRVRQTFEAKQSVYQERRRAEDRVREELHDERARVITPVMDESGA
jgi:hypothetical protein